MLDCEFVARRRTLRAAQILGRISSSKGTTDGHAKAAEISRGILRSILDSALGLKPDDMSPQARAGRTVSLKHFDNMTFIAKIGIEKGKPKNDGTGENWPTRTLSRR